MKKYIFTWYVGDGYTYGYDVHIPFECEDIDALIFEQLEKLDKCEWNIEFLGLTIDKKEAYNFDKSFKTLEQWFDANKRQNV